MDKFTRHPEYRSTDKNMWLNCIDTNERGETLLVNIHQCEMDFDHKYGLGYLWKRDGRIDGSFKTWWHIDCYVHSPKKCCFAGYNPQEMTYKSKPDRDGHVCVRGVIDFDWLLEDTDKNLERILNEIYRRFMRCEPRHIAPEDYIKA